MILPKRKSQCSQQPEKHRTVLDSIYVEPRRRVKYFGCSVLIHCMAIGLLFVSPEKKTDSLHPVHFVQIVELPQQKTTNIRVEPEKSKAQLLRPVPKTIREKKPAAKIKDDDSFSGDEYLKELKNKLSAVKIPSKHAKKNKSEPISFKAPNLEKIKTMAKSSINIQSNITNYTDSTIPDWYLSLVKNKIREYWHMNESFLSTSATVSFRLFKNGSISNTMIEKSSGYENFDRSVLYAVGHTGKLPPFPKEIRKRCLDIVIEFTAGR